MKIEYMLTRKHIWQYHLYDWWTRSSSQLILLLVWPLLFACLTFASEFRKGIGHALLYGGMVELAIVLYQLVALLLVVTYKSWRVVKTTPTGIRIAEIGKFDLRWGSPQSVGYYHHWSYFEEIVSTRDLFYFILTDSRALIVPKSAFGDASESSKFYERSKQQWEIAKANQRYHSAAAGDAWPPPPRMGA